MVSDIEIFPKTIKKNIFVKFHGAFLGEERKAVFRIIGSLSLFAQGDVLRGSLLAAASYNSTGCFV